MTKMAVSYQPSAVSSETHKTGDWRPETLDSRLRSLVSSLVADSGRLTARREE